MAYRANVVDSGATLGYTSDSTVRAANKAALLAAISTAKTIEIPGELYLPANAAIDWPAARTLEGCGQWEGQAALIGDGNILTLTTAGESRTMRNLRLANESTRGKHVYATLPSALGRVEFTNVTFGKAQQHVYCTGGFAVDWVFDKSKFEDASSYSRFFDGGVSSLKDIAVTCTNNYRHVYLSAETGAYVVTVASFGSIYEGATNAGWYLLASSGDIYSVEFHGAHFEHNGTATGGADVELLANSGRTLHSVAFFGGGFHAPSTGQSQRIGMYEGGTIGRVLVNGTIVEGNVVLAPNSNKIHVNAVRHVGNSPQAAWKTATYS
ncbi:hypothetical protein J8F10_24035 [Gemmata sp. G18]|uniref:Pectate lyase superfamily protein domain-containing protein n=1 Tax=Gemmata palustris TaxID=2822762 RepID=A0ABS5BX64_9BACT|nr:hypothetical protein [Gemmata palustris]MBP3958330.1 hypothetical protein [Gemmata palustris]